MEHRALIVVTSGQHADPRRTAPKGDYRHGMVIAPRTRGPTVPASAAKYTRSGRVDQYAAGCCQPAVGGSVYARKPLG